MVKILRVLWKWLREVRSRRLRRRRWAWRKERRRTVKCWTLSGTRISIFDDLWRRKYLTEVDVEAGKKAKFGDLVMDVGISALRVLLMGSVIEKNHDVLEDKYKDAMNDVEKWKHKATGLESRLSGMLKENKTADKATEDAKNAREVAEAEREDLRKKLVATQAELETSKGDLALYFDNGFERAKEQVLHFNPDAKLDDLDPFKILVNDELVEEVEEEAEE